MVSIQKVKSKKPGEFLSLIRAYVAEHFGPIAPTERVSISIEAIGNLVIVTTSKSNPKLPSSAATSSAPPETAN